MTTNTNATNNTVNKNNTAHTPETESNKDLKSIEFQVIIDQLAEYTVSEQAKAFALTLEPKNSLEAIRESHREISEAVAIMAAGGMAPLNKQTGIRSAVDQMEKGYVLSPAFLHESASFLWDMEKLSLYLKGKIEVAPTLAAYGRLGKAIK